MIGGDENCVAAATVDVNWTSLFTFHYCSYLSSVTFLDFDPILLKLCINLLKFEQLLFA